MNTHEFARLLLEKQDKPLFVQEHYSCQGEYYTGYSEITGVVSGIVEEGYIISVDYLNAAPNDNFYRKGDFFLPNLTTKLSPDEFLYMVVYKEDKYIAGEDISVGFYELREEVPYYERVQLEHKIKVVIEEGWQPNLVEMSIEGALIWFKNEFPEMFVEGGTCE